MTTEANIPIHPIASWQIGPVFTHGVVTFCLNYLDHPNQKPEDANPGRYYALTPPQVLDLIADLQKALAKLEISDFQVHSEQSH